MRASSVSSIRHCRISSTMMTVPLGQKGTIVSGDAVSSIGDWPNAILGSPTNALPSSKTCLMFIAHSNRLIVRFTARKSEQQVKLRQVHSNLMILKSVLKPLYGSFMLQPRPFTTANKFIMLIVGAVFKGDNTLCGARFRLA